MFVENNPLELSPARTAARVEDCIKQTEFMKSNLNFLVQAKPALGRSEMRTRVLGRKNEQRKREAKLLAVLQGVDYASTVLALVDLPIVWYRTNACAKNIIKEVPMPNFRWRLVRRRRPKAEDLSFPPPAREQARYIKLADEFLAHFTSEESDRIRSGEFVGQAPAAKSGRAAYARKSLHLLYLPASSKA